MHYAHFEEPAHCFEQAHPAHRSGLVIHPNAWAGTGIENLGHTKLRSCCLWTNIPRPVIESLCHCTFQPPALAARAGSTDFLTLESHTPCTSVRAVLSQAPLVLLWIYQTSMHCSTVCRPPGSLGIGCVALPRCSKWTPPHPISSVINSVLVRRSCVASVHPSWIDLAPCRQLVEVYWNDLSNNDLSIFILGKALYIF